MGSQLIDATKAVISRRMIVIRCVAPDWTRISPPRTGEFCHRHFSWLCQAGQGQCQGVTRPASPGADSLACQDCYDVAHDEMDEREQCDAHQEDAG